MYPGFEGYQAPSQPGDGMQSSSNSGGSSDNSVPSQFYQATPQQGVQQNHLNYTNKTGDYMRLLSKQEKNEVEIPREIYVNIKLLDVLEKNYSFDRIQKQDYLQRSQQCIDKIEKFKNFLLSKNPNFTIDVFIQEYGLQDCNWAIQKLKKGPQKEDDSSTNVKWLIAQVISSFMSISDHFVINGDSCTPRQVIPMLEKISLFLNKLKPEFQKSHSEADLDQKYVPVLKTLNQLDPGSILSQDMITEVQEVNEYVKNKFENYLNSK